MKKGISDNEQSWSRVGCFKNIFLLLIESFPSHIQHQLGILFITFSVYIDKLFSNSYILSNISSYQRATIIFSCHLLLRNTARHT